MATKHSTPRPGYRPHPPTRIGSRVKPFTLTYDERASSRRHLLPADVAVHAAQIARAFAVSGHVLLVGHRAGIKQLRGDLAEFYAIRFCGSYRIVLAVNPWARAVLVARVEHRSTVYLPD